MIRSAISIAAVLGLCAGLARAQDQDAERTPVEMLNQLTQMRAEADGPQLSESVRALINAAYLTDDERRAARVFHGQWRDEDLLDPRLRAKAALTVGAWRDASLSDPAADIEDRAEALLRRGDLPEAVELLNDATSVRAQRIRAEALEGLGRFEDADKAVEPVVAKLIQGDFTSAEDVVEGVRALRVRARVRGQPAEDFHRMNGLLALTRDQIDRLYYPAMIVEAELLYDKDNRQQAAEAALRALELNPAAADAWSLLGRLSVGSFAFDQARDAAATMDENLRTFTGDDKAVNVHAAMIRATAWMRQNDPELAAVELDPLVRTYPRLRELLALRSAILALSWRDAELAYSLAEFDALSPGSPEALFAVGKALAEVRQYESAADYLERASARQPKLPAPLIELGLLELQSGRDVRALDALRKAVDLDPFNVRAANSLALIEELLTYDTVESEHFVVRFRPGVDGVMAREMLEPLEEIHGVVGGAIEHTPDRKTTIELMPDHQWFAVRITGMPAIHTIAAATGPVIAMEAPKVGPRHTGEYDWVRVIRHEYVHTVTLSRTKNRIAHWFTEAAAVYLEGGPRDYGSAGLLAQATRDNELFDMVDINIAFVRPEKPTDRSKAYAQGHWMYEFIVERWGAQAPLDMMDLYANGAREDEAMRSVLGVSREDFFQQFKPWAAAQVQTWGMMPEPSMESLIAAWATQSPEWLARARATMANNAWAFASLTSGGAAAHPERLTLPRPTPAAIESWLVEHPDHPDLLQATIEIQLAANGQEPTTAMIPLLERYAAARPVDPMPHRHLARLHLASDDPSRAIPHLEYLDIREQKSAAYAIELSRRYAALNELDKAATKSARATQIAPFNASYREFAARVALLQKDLPTAERHILALTELEPSRPEHQQRLERIRAMMSEG